MLELDKIYNMDCIEGMKQIDDSSIDAVVTDPPFGVNKKDIDDGMSLDLYYKILPELFRVMKDNSWFITFCATKRLPDMFENNPFEYCWCGFIYYRNIQRIINSPIGRTKISMYIIFKKGKPTRKAFIFDIQEHLYPDKEKKYNHPANKPKKPIEYLIRFCSKKNDIVLDPFIGSGTTALVCKQLNRHYIGFEINKEYYDISIQRLLNVPERLEKWIDS